jgi:predicted MPP superfamily phosphohydrolase
MTDRLPSRVITRRDFLKLTGIATFAMLGVTTAYSLLGNEAESPVVERVQIPIPNLPPALDGFRIVQISDIHYYPLTTIELVDRAVQMANQLAPDLIVLTGDFVWHEVESIFDLMPSLMNLDAIHGVYAGLGNHDIWTDVRVVTRAMEDAGMPLLVNQGVPISVGNSTLYLASLDDGWAGKPNLKETMANWPEDAPTVLLMHEPDLAPRYALDKRINLQLSGHSHGGQIRFPFYGPLVLPYLSWKYPMGLYNVDGMWLYTNRGLGTTNVPVRVNCAPEITELTLVSG